MRGTHGVCHLLTDAAEARPSQMLRLEAVDWAMSIALEIARHLAPADANPGVALAEYLREHGVDYPDDAVPLPGTPCETCVATQIIPGRAIEPTLELSRLLQTSEMQAFQWASRVGAIVLSYEVVDRAQNPQDALGALVMSEYAASRQRALRCDLKLSG